MEQLNHTEVAVNHRIGKSARVQAAAYHDGLRNAAVWGLGHCRLRQAFAGNALPNPAGNGIVINGGNYQSTGFRAVYAQTFRLARRGAGGLFFRQCPLGARLFVNARLTSLLAGSADAASRPMP